jgi:hypothetical protein
MNKQIRFLLLGIADGIYRRLRHSANLEVRSSWESRRAGEAVGRQI